MARERSAFVGWTGGAFLGARSGRGAVSWWASIIVIGGLVAIGRVLFPGMDLRRSGPFVVAALFAYWLIEKGVNKYLTARENRRSK